MRRCSFVVNFSRLSKVIILSLIAVVLAELGVILYQQYRLDIVMRDVTIMRELVRANSRYAVLTERISYSCQRTLSELMDHLGLPTHGSASIVVREWNDIYRASSGVGGTP